MNKSNKFFDELNFLNIFKLELEKINTLKELNLLRVKYFGKKGIISKKITRLQYLDLHDRKNFGKIINNIKCSMYIFFQQKKEILDKKESNKKEILQDIDISLPGRRKNIGSMHPITNIIYYIESIFRSFGFCVINKSFEIENQYYNFDALNIPVYHPARNTQDTFWFDSDRLLRTQTSNMQIHEIKKKHLPIQIIVPGKVYRKDNDYTHSPIFHQVEGLVIDKGANFSNLIWVIKNFLKCFFNKSMKIRFRSSYFPFTVLSTEVDIMTDQDHWLEVLGCGMVHPNILDRFDIDKKIYSGFAFGMGVERMIMLYYGINDLRLFFKNDIKFLKQFDRSRYY
ncbi:phenylalanine--tRNA ligase subunit alpha [Buchnera aphidicola]|uniref:phenylalanine--tRNA ligase subunit alpha n=1 Tax=Buchnera aphidicola TaxID=9 RepID=UPI0031B8952A